MSEAIVGKWGKSLAVRLPGEVAQAGGFGAGERVEITVEGDRIVIRHTAPRFTLKELFRGKSPQDWRALYAGSFDWGPDRGREVVEE